MGTDSGARPGGLREPLPFASPVGHHGLGPPGPACPGVLIGTVSVSMINGPGTADAAPTAGEGGSGEESGRCHSKAVWIVAIESISAPAGKQWPAGHMAAYPSPAKQRSGQRGEGRDGDS